MFILCKSQMQMWHCVNIFRFDRNKETNCVFLMRSDWDFMHAFLMLGLQGWQCNAQLGTAQRLVIFKGIFMFLLLEQSCVCFRLLFTLT